jgi:hypothetical protein
VPGDGRCLFRAVAHGACLRSGRSAPDESTQRQMADDLRNKAVDELVRRRESSEWYTFTFSALSFSVPFGSVSATANVRPLVTKSVCGK